MKILYSILLFGVLASCSYEDFESPWIELNTDPRITSFSDVIFLDENIGLVTRGYIPEPFSPVLLRTEDAGTNWSIQELRPPTVAGFGQYFALNDHIIYTIGTPYDSIATSSARFLYKSVDRGETWNRILGDFYKNPGNIFFWDENNGMVCGGGIFKTEDGGVSWREILNTDNIFFFGVGSTIFTSYDVGYISGGAKFDGTNFGIIAKTEDHGESWKNISQNVKNNLGMVVDKFFLNDDIGFLFTVDYELFKTEDGGDSWLLVRNRIPLGVAESFFHNTTEGYAVGDAGIFHTQDGGKTWSRENRTTSTADVVTGITFPTPDVGYAVSLEGKILKRIIK